MLEMLKENKLIVAIVVFAISAIAVVYFMGHGDGFDAGFAKGYQKGQADSICDGGSHYRPWSPK